MMHPAPSPPETLDTLEYPDSDGNAMADNTEQFTWIVTIKENLEILLAENPNVFVAGDLLWYPVRGSLERTAPDVLVAFGRPKGKRGSYKQWEEDGIAPQVVFEILSPSNKDRRGFDALEMKHDFYDRYGVEEYYIYDPEDRVLSGWQRGARGLDPIAPIDGWVSPRLGIRFAWAIGREVEIFRPDGRRFLTPLELEQHACQAEQQAERERERAERESQRAERERERAERERERAERLAAQLRALGIDPDELGG